jgi:dsDNA-binding SOS-regulon protein
MALTTERSEKLGKYLADNKDNAQALLELAPEQAVEKINADGFDFTADELKEFGEELKKAALQSESGELDAASLEGVSGGVITFAAAAAGIGIVMGGYALGKDIANRWGW